MRRTLPPGAVRDGKAIFPAAPLHPSPQPTLAAPAAGRLSLCPAPTCASCYLGRGGGRWGGWGCSAPEPWRAGRAEGDPARLPISTWVKRWGGSSDGETPGSRSDPVTPSSKGPRWPPGPQAKPWTPGHAPRCLPRLNAAGLPPASALRPQLLRACPWRSSSPAPPGDPPSRAEAPLGSCTGRWSSLPWNANATRAGLVSVCCDLARRCSQ